MLNALKLLLPLIGPLVNAYKAKSVARSSELYVAIATLAGAALVPTGIVTQADFDKVLYPAIIYIVGRVASKIAAAKAASAPPSA